MSSAIETLKAGLRHHQAGQLDRAETLYRQALRIDPAQPHGLHLLGLACHQQGRSEAAVEYFDRAIPCSEPTADIYHNRAAALFVLGRLDEAMADCRRALEIDPDYVDAQQNLGHALNEKGEFVEAEKWCRRALELDPQRAGAHLNLGRALKGQRRRDEALAAYQRSLQLDPGCAETHNNLGNLHRANGQLDDAVASYQRAIRIEPAHLRAIRNHATVLCRQDKFLQAEPVCRKALAVDPDDAESHVLLGTVLEGQSRADEALACFHRALQIDPRSAATLAGLATFHERMNDLQEAEQYATQGLELAADDPRLNLIVAKCERRQGRFQEAIDRLERARRSVPNDNALGEGTGAAILAQLGAIHDRCGRADEAFAACQEGNRLHAREAEVRGLEQGTLLEAIAQARTVYQPPLVATWTPAPPLENESPPVFMTGFPRSGTTLLDQVLDSHPSVQTLEEKPTMKSVKQVLGTYGSAPLKVVCGLMPEQFAGLRDAYFEEVARHLEREPELVLVDRSPFLMPDVGLAHRLFPNARFILAVRHPCDVCLSCFMQSFQLHLGTVHFFNIEDAARLYAATMCLWQQLIRVLPLDYHVVRYEDLLDDFEGQTRRLLDFVNVGWDDRVRRHTEHARTRRIRTASYHQVVEPLYRRSRFRWRRYAKHLAPVIDVLRPHIEYFGYEAEA